MVFPRDVSECCTRHNLNTKIVKGMMIRSSKELIIDDSICSIFQLIRSDKNVK